MHMGLVIFNFGNTILKTKQDKGHYEQFKRLHNSWVSNSDPIIPFADIVNTTKQVLLQLTHLLKKMKLHYSIIYLKDLITLCFNLGFLNVIYIIWYRLTLITGFRKLFFSSKESIIVDQKIFNKSSHNLNYSKEWLIFIKKADRILDGKMIYFFSTSKEIGNPPNWFKNPYNNKILKNDFHWIETNEFGLKQEILKYCGNLQDSTGL